MPNPKSDAFFKKMGAQGIMVTYGDVLLRTRYSNILPTQTNLTTRFSRNVSLRIPVVSSPMDRVTEAPMAIAMATFGGLGIIHKNMTIEEQAKQVRRVKLHLNGRVDAPICVNPYQTLAQVREMQQDDKFTFDSFPVVYSGLLVGMLTGSCFKFTSNLGVLVKDVMTNLDQVVLAPEDTTQEDAFMLMQKRKVSTIPLVNDLKKVVGMYVWSDLIRVRLNQSMHNTDRNGQLIVGAAVGAGESTIARAKILVEAGCDVLIIDTAHGWSEGVIGTVMKLKELYPGTDVVAGNVSVGEGALALVEAGADGVLVGQGPGSICTTRIMTGVGCPQVSAVHECAKALRDRKVPVCADGGIQNPGDIAIALAVGAESVMLGGILAATDASPGEVFQIGQQQVKEYRGMGSLGAMRDNKASRERYLQSDVSSGKLVPEGVESHVPYKGPLTDVLNHYVGGVRASMGYLGAVDIASFQAVAEPFRNTNAGLRESHPHDLVGTQK